jgi:hypothetical protein
MKINENFSVAVCLVMEVFVSLYKLCENKLTVVNSDHSEYNHVQQANFIS